MIAFVSMTGPQELSKSLEPPRNPLVPQRRSSRMTLPMRGFSHSNAKKVTGWSSVPRETASAS